MTYDRVYARMADYFDADPNMVASVKLIKIEIAHRVFLAVFNFVCGSYLIGVYTLWSVPMGLWALFTVVSHSMKALSARRAMSEQIVREVHDV